MESVKDFAKAKNQKLALDCYSKLDGIKTITSATICEAEVGEKSSSAGKALNIKEAFNRRKQQLIQELKDRRNNLIAKEQQERNVEDGRRTKAEKELLQQEKEAEEQRKHEASVATELSSGINLNGITERKTIESLLRTLKRWVENLNGTIGAPETEVIKSRFVQVYFALKAKEKQPWLQKLKNDIPRLSAFLTKDQIADIEQHLNTLE